ncbi:MAG TPA: hypothetical protein VLE99_01335 [Candidatus Saccharimonadales bacterium]|nr:hypothetical protein [Candidatus Saccharimonadales bacterium]
MSDSMDTPRRRPTRAQYLVVGAVVALLALGMVALSLRNSSQPSSYEAARAVYERALLNDPNRTNGDFGVQIHDNADGAVYTYETSAEMMRGDDGVLRNDCEARCMVGRKTVDGYAITLPVAFDYSVGMQSFSPMPGSQPVTELTYWDPQQHKPVTVRSSGGRAVTLPKVLYRRNADDVRKGETVYTVPEWVRSDNGRTVVLDQAIVWHEPGGSLYGTIDLAKLTRTGEGFEVCLPKGDYQPINEKDVRGPEARVLSERC